MKRTNRISKMSLGLGLSLLVVMGLAYSAAAQTWTPTSKAEQPSAVKPQIVKAYGGLPLSFELNQGQSDPQVKFLSRANGYTSFVTPTELVLVLGQPAAGGGLKTVSSAQRQRSNAAGVAATVLRMQLVGADPRSQIEGLDELPGKANYFIGKDPKNWHTNIPTYGRVRYRDVYPGIDLLYYGNQGRVEHDFIVRPGGDPRAIQLGLKGADKTEVDAQGNLILHVRGGEVRLQRPVVYQEVNGGRREIAAAYKLQANRRVSFEVAQYDTSQSLVVDPVLVYSTYLGGSDFDGFGVGAIAVDATGAAYVAASSCSPDFPTTSGSLQPTFAGGTCSLAKGVVAKLNPTGTALVFSTYIGSDSAQDGAGGLAVDSSGNVYVTGFTLSTNFPTTSGAFQTTLTGNNTYVLKLDPTGSTLIYSTALGGSGSGVGIAIDSSGNAYVVGTADGGGLPSTAGAFQTAYGGGANDTFVAKLNPTGSALVYATYLGGNDLDTPQGIAVDSTGSAYVVGITRSTNFPTVNAVQSTFAGGPDDAFVAKLNPAGSALVYSTFLGGSGETEGIRLATDSTGSAYAVGLTSAADFPITPGAFQTTFAGGPYDCFITKLSSAGGLVFSSYLGSGSGLAVCYGVAVDPVGNVFLGGATNSSSFPLVNPMQGYAGGLDAIVATFNSTGNALTFSTFLGGSGDEGVGHVALDTAGGIYVLGSTTSANFPTTPGAIQRTYAGGQDLFVAKLSLDTTPPEIRCGAPDGLWHASDVTIACTAQDTGSGLANPADASFSLSTNVAGGTETANAFTGSRTVCDNAGNCATAGPIGGNMVDKKAPTISITSPTSTTYALNQAVAAAYSCSDGGSGVASCAGPVGNGSNISTAPAGAKTFTVNAADNVGNIASRAVNYTISYNICVLYDQTRSVKSGAPYPIRLYLCDAAGSDVSSLSIVLHATQVTGVSGFSGDVEASGNANPDNDFHFAATLGPSGGYTFNLGTAGLASGTYSLHFTATGDPVDHTVMFGVK